MIDSPLKHVAASLHFSKIKARNSGLLLIFAEYFGGVALHIQNDPQAGIMISYRPPYTD